MKGKIEVNNIRLYAHHGCLAEERIIGSPYRVDVWVRVDLMEAAQSDNLKDAVDYVNIHKIVEEEMKIPANLLENVAYRILHRLKKEMPSIQSSKVCVAKINPPINGNVEEVRVCIKD